MYYLRARLAKQVSYHSVEKILGLHYTFLFKCSKDPSNLENSQQQIGLILLCEADNESFSRS